MICLIRVSCLVAAAGWLMLTANVLAQDTTFTYQGQLEDGGAPFTGQVDMEFGLFDALSGGSPVSPPLERFDVSVEDGVFQVELDFGPSTFGADLRYLEIRVDGMLLNPRQAIRPAPIALFALDGNSGPQGEPGPEGPPGLQGPQGIQGPTGDTGPAGADGVSVQIASYSGALCPNGGVILSAVNGDEVVCHGEQGLQGPEGPAGTGQIYPLSQLNVFASSSSEFILFGPQVLLPFGATSEAGVQLGVDLAFFEGTGEFSLCWGNVESGPGTPMLTDQGETLSFTLSQGATGLQNFTGVVSPGTSGDFWVGGCVRSSQVSAESVSGFVTFAGN